jgi:hypothetical protein
MYEDIDLLGTYHFLQCIWRAYGIIEGVVVRVNFGHGNVSVILNVTNCGNL